jgi:hypothetical protein
MTWRHDPLIDFAKAAKGLPAIPLGAARPRISLRLGPFASGSAYAPIA